MYNYENIDCIALFINGEKSKLLSNRKKLVIIVLKSKIHIRVDVGVILMIMIMHND